MLAPNKNVITRPASPLLLLFFFFLLLPQTTDAIWAEDKHFLGDKRGFGAATAGGKYGARLKRGSYFTAVLFVSAGGGSCDEDEKE